MASGSSMMGFGRGGRGKSLKELLNQPVRKPGESPSQPREQHSPPKVEATTPSAPSAAAQDVPPPSPTAAAPMAMGRGLTKALLATHISPKPTVPQPQPQLAMSPRVPGRGAGLSGKEATPSAPAGRAAMLQKQPAVVRAPAQVLGARPTAVPAPKMDPSFNKKGTCGEGISLSANYLMLKAEGDGIYQYHVYFEPVVENKRTRYGMVASMEDLIGRIKCFDGTILFLPRKITDSVVVRKAVRETDKAEITITLKLVSLIQSADKIRLFNIIFRNVQRALELTQIGRNYYDSKASIPLPQHKMELWPGYVASIHEQDGGLLMCFDASHRLLRTDTAYDHMTSVSARGGNIRDSITKQLVGCIVLTKYNNKTYRIDEIDWDKNPKCTFLNHQGENITFIEYYKNHYGLEIKDEGQPLLIHRPRVKGRSGDSNQQQEPQSLLICLIPELCQMTGLLDSDRSDFRVMKDIANYTRVQPHAREAVFRKFVQRVNSTPKAKDILAGWGLQIDPMMIQWDGRTLPVEKIYFGKETVLVGEDADWGRDAVKKQLISTIPLRNWVVVVTKRDAGKAMDFVQMMKKVGPPMGMQVADAKVMEIANDRTDTYLNAVRQQIGSHLQLVVTIFPTSRDDRYAALKKLCCIDSPIPSQVINARTISQQQKLRSVTQKIALQINCKLGGELWAVEIPLKNMMVIGIDVYHDSTFGKKKSVVGFVASNNKHMSKWYSRVVIQGQRQEIIDGLKMCFQAALKRYHELNQVLPDRIVVYRDGVGDGQMFVVKEYEEPQLRSCFKLFGEEYSPKMTVIVVQKRISTRIFKRGGAQGLSNPPPGTVADHIITRKDWYDFFLVSQHVRQGTVTPTHYVVVSDNSGLKPDHMQRLTYKMTHMYYNWPGTIRAPAPCQYAHKLAFLVGQSLHREPSVHLSDRLFFL